MRRVARVILMIACVALLRRGFVDAAPATTQPAAVERRGPITYQHVIREDPVNHIFILRIDLTDPRVRLRVCAGGGDPDGEGPWETTLSTVREIAEREQLAAAVNANFFACKEARRFAGRTIPYFTGNWATVSDWAMSDGRLWSRVDGGGPSLVIGSRGVRFGTFPTTLPSDARDVVSGVQMVLVDGKVRPDNSARAPRTAVGLDRASQTLFLVVVDGRNTAYSTGMTPTELGNVMLEIGAASAMMLDGGGSSTMVLRDGIENVARVMNRPSDGHDLPIPLSLERPVACVLGVQIRDEQR